MPGVKGGLWSMQKGLKVWRINNKYNIIYIHGPVIPGPNHCYVRVADTCLPTRKKFINSENHPPFPTFLVDEVKEALPEEVFDERLHQFKEPTLKFDDFQTKIKSKREGAKIAKIK
jgi:large subunit ribosomal protein L3